MKNFLSLFFPEEVDFFSPMSKMYDLISQSVKVYLAAVYRGALSPEEKESLLARLKTLERDGDKIIREINAELKRTFTPPYSPAELIRLFKNLDDALDRLDESAKMSVHADYRPDFPPFVKDQLKVFARGVEQAGKTVELLRDPRRNTAKLSGILSDISVIEAEGDRIYWPNKQKLSSQINAAAKENRLSDYRRLVMDEKTLDQLEEIVDTLVEIMKVIQSMIIEHA